MSTPTSAARVDELASVRRFPCRAGGHGTQLGVEAVGDPLHPRQAGQATIEGLGGEHLHVPATGAEAHDLTFAGQRLETVATDWAGDDEVDAVRPDVDGRQGASRLSVQEWPLRQTISRR